MNNDRFKFRVWAVGPNRYYDEEDVFLKPDGTGLVKTFFDKEVKCRIVEQCTGKEDWDDKLIFENDIIEKGDTHYRVQWDYFNASWFAQSMDNKKHFLDGDEFWKHCVVGTIHDKEEE